MLKQIFSITFALLIQLTVNVGDINAQQLPEKTNIRIYEHHSSEKTGEVFGVAENGSQSGYDFIKHQYIGSYNIGAYAAYAWDDDIVDNIDIVEHNGPFGNNGDFGFTSTISSIEISNGYIRGNQQSKYMLAPKSFNYESATIEDIINSYNEKEANTDVEAVTEGEIYIGRLRNSTQYVAIKITNVKNFLTREYEDDVYFDFNYKYGSGTVGINNSLPNNEVKLFPNPANSKITLQLNGNVSGSHISIYNNVGQLQSTYIFTDSAYLDLDIENLPKGVYYIKISDVMGVAANSISFIKI